MIGTGPNKRMICYGFACAWLKGGFVVKAETRLAGCSSDCL